jgi:hypothetical protein
MKIDPFELHPAIEKLDSTQATGTIAKRTVFAIIEDISRRVDQLPQKTWGYDRNDILEALEEVRERVTTAVPLAAP